MAAHGAPRGAPRRPGLAQALLDGAEHRLAVGVAPLVVADLAQLGRLEIGQARGDLARGEVVVAEDRERRPDADAAARLVDLAQRAVAALRRAGPRLLAG